MKVNHVLTTLVFLALTTNLFAQRHETIFKNGFGLTGIWGGPKYNFSVFDEDVAYVRGGTFAFEFGNTVLVGWSGTNFRDEVVIEGVSQGFKLDYSNFMVNITPNSYRAIHPVMGVQLGGGKLEFENNDSERVFVVQPSAGFEINIFKFMRLGLKGGYRFVSDIDTQGIENADISSPFGQINLKFGFSWGTNDLDWDW